MVAKLVTTEYNPPGVYIQEIITPAPGFLPQDRRVASYVGRGSRLAKVSNSAIRRSFVFGEVLDVSASAPYEASLSFPADGNKNSPIRVYDSLTGIELLPDQWNFIQVAGLNSKIVISPDVYNPAAQYRMDYQSVSRDVLDPLPISDLRVIKSLGTVPDRAQFKDYFDFYIPYAFVGPTLASSNSFTSSFLTSVFADGSNSGFGSVSIPSSASFNHDYNRYYVLECTSATGSAGSFTASFKWSAQRYSGGRNSLPPTPLDDLMDKPEFVADQSVPASLTADLELGIKVEVVFDSATNFSVGDLFYFNAVGPGRIEFDSRFDNSNQFISYGSITKTEVAGSTGALSYDSSTAFSGKRNNNFKLQVIAASGAIGSRSVTISWASYGDLIGTSSTAVVLESSPLLVLTEGIVLSVNFGASNFQVGDVFAFSVKAPKMFYQAKDNRLYNLSVSLASNPGADSGFISGSYSTGTPEGGFGVWEAEANLLSGLTAKDSSFALPDGVEFFARNIMRGNINGVSYSPSDKFTASVTSSDVIDWSLTRQVEEVRETTAVRTDVTGAVTGVAGTYYLVLSNEYESGSVDVVIDSTSAPVSFIEIPGTRFLALLDMPSAALRISCEFRGEEPAPGQLYFMTAHYLRPADMYNKPILVLTRQEGQALLAPAETSNHLYIMNELGFNNSMPGAVYIQVSNPAGDGVFTREDFRRGIRAHETSTRSTDLVVLANFESLPDALAANERGNDAFEKRWQMLYVGAPIGTQIGTADTPNTLVSLARRTLQTTPTSQAMGTRVLVAPTRASVELALENGVVTDVVLDGSFVAGALAALVNSFQDPGADILRRNINGFKTLQTYSSVENKILGAASIMYFSDRGSSVFRCEENITVHDLDEQYQLINQATQKHYVVRAVERAMDASVIGVVPPNTAAAISLIRSNLQASLIGLLGNGIIADYQDADGNVRSFDPDKDLLIVRRAGSKTAYDFYFAFYTRFGIKRLFGLYSMNTNNFGA